MHKGLVFFPQAVIGSQIGKFEECVGDLSYIQISCAAVFVDTNSSIGSFCCFTKISWLELRLKFNPIRPGVFDALGSLGGLIRPP